MNKKLPEATINLLTALSGAAWRQVQHIADEAPDQGEEGFDKGVKALDQAFRYDDRVEMPKALDKFFYGPMAFKDVLSRLCCNTAVIIARHCSSWRNTASSCRLQSLDGFC